MKQEYLGIEIDYSRDQSLTDQSLTLLKNFYCRDTDNSPQEAFARAAVCYSDDRAMAQRIYDYVSKQWFMFASPVLSNAVEPGEKPKGLPISCFLAKIDDSLEGLIDHTSETRWLSVKGGGIGGHWSDVRAVSDIAPGPIPFLHTIDADIQAYKQGKTRKGAYAAYMDVSHPDIEEFIQIRVPTSGGDVNRKAFNLHNAVNIPDAFMEAVMKDENWDLVDPKTKEVRKTLRARSLWEEILTVRYRTGEPYLHFIDETNRKMPTPLRELGLLSNGSNLCSEITLPTSEDRTAVCCLSSLNLHKYDEWKETTIVEDMIVFLDNVLQFFIDHAPDQISRARYSAERERSLGLGTFGWHAYLQSKMIAFDSEEALEENRNVYADIQRRALKSSVDNGHRKGPYPDFVAYLEKLKRDGIQNDDFFEFLKLVHFRRNSHLIAIAPNANSASLAGTSPSIELWRSNAYVHDTRAGTHIVKNPELEALLKRKGYFGSEADKIWLSILNHDGSIQQLTDIFTEKERQVFKTAFEVDQIWVVRQAAERQQYVCQAQSVNLYFPANMEKSKLNQVHLAAWRSKLKTLYYLRTKSSKKVEQMNTKVEREALKDFTPTKSIPDSDINSDSGECTACHA